MSHSFPGGNPERPHGVVHGADTGQRRPHYAKRPAGIGATLAAPARRPQSTAPAPWPSRSRGRCHTNSNFRMSRRWKGRTIAEQSTGESVGGELVEPLADSASPSFDRPRTNGQGSCARLRNRPGWSRGRSERVMPRTLRLRWPQELAGQVLVHIVHHGFKAVVGAPAPLLGGPLCRQGSWARNRRCTAVAGQLRSPSRKFGTRRRMASASSSGSKLMELTL